MQNAMLKMKFVHVRPFDAANVATGLCIKNALSAVSFIN